MAALQLCHPWGMAVGLLGLCCRVCPWGQQAPTGKDECTSLHVGCEQKWSLLTALLSPQLTQHVFKGTG